MSILMLYRLGKAFYKYLEKVMIEKFNNSLDNPIVFVVVYRVHYYGALRLFAYF